MTFTETFSLISALSLLAIAITLIPVLLRFGRTLREMEIFFQSLNQQIDPLCRSLTDAGNELQTLSRSLNNAAGKTEAVIDTARLSADTLLTTSRMFKEALRPCISSLGGFSAGVRAFAHFLGTSRKN